MKIDEYIVTIQAFSKIYENKEKFYPSIYKIISIKHMVNNQNIDKIELYNTEHVCKNTYYNETTFFKHNKYLHVNDLAVYENMCDQDNFIEIYSENNNTIFTNNKLKICIVNQLYPAYIDEQYAFYNQFFEEEQWKLFPNGYSGFCKRYDNEIEEFYHTNDKKDGKYKIYYNLYKDKLKSETNYIDGKKNGEELHYDDNGKCIEKIYNYSENFYYYEKFDNNNKVIKSGYYYMDIPCTKIYIYYVLCLQIIQSLFPDLHIWSNL